MITRSTMGRRAMMMMLGFFLAGLPLLPVHGEKEGMPDLVQVDETCLPTAMTNLMVWFGQHGYPDLIAPGDSKTNGFITTVHRVMTATDARFDQGTRPEKIAEGMEKYVSAAGYSASVEFRGLGTGNFTSEWLKENDQPNKGFVLLLMYCSHNPNNDTYTNAWHAGHAVTLVNSGSDFILVHDPAHMSDEVGRKILTPEVLTHGTWRAQSGGTAPMAGLMLLSGSFLDAPPGAQVIMIGAVCVTMHNKEDMIASSSSGATDSAAPTIAGRGGDGKVIPTAPATPVSGTKGWEEWLFNWIFSK